MTAPKSLGEELHDQIIEREGRKRLTYAHAQALEKITSVEELRDLCAKRHEEEVPADATIDEILNVWLTPVEQKSSDSDLVPTDEFEGWIVILVAGPFLLAGYGLGRGLYACGIDVSRMTARSGNWIAIVGLFFAIAGAALTYNFGTLWAAVAALPATFAVGMLYGLKDRRGFHSLSAIGCFVGASATIVLSLQKAPEVSIFFIEQQPIIWLIVACLIAIGLGYGLMRNPSEFRAKRSRNPFRRSQSPL